MSQDFITVTDNLALNFINTQMKSYGKTIELIETQDALNNWLCVQKEQLTQADTQYHLSILENLLRDDIDLSVIKAFRNTLSDYMKQKTPEDWILFLKEVLQDLPCQIDFIDQQMVLVPTKSGIDCFKTIIFIHLSRLVEQGLLTKLKYCENPECILLFINKSGRRKWCAMQICGNRAKVKNFHDRQQKRRRC